MKSSQKNTNQVHWQKNARVLEVERSFVTHQVCARLNFFGRFRLCCKWQQMMNRRIPTQRFLLPPPRGSVVMVMTMAMNIWGMLLVSCKWRGGYHPYVMTRVIQTCACTHTILTQTPNIESRMRQTEAMAVSLNLTNLSHWLPRGISSFNNRERKRQRYQKGKKIMCINIYMYTHTISYQFASFTKLMLQWPFIPFWEKIKKTPKDTSSHITFTYT